MNSFSLGKPMHNFSRGEESGKKGAVRERWAILLSDQNPGALRISFEEKGNEVSPEINNFPLKEHGKP